MHIIKTSVHADRSEESVHRVTGWIGLAAAVLDELVVEHPNRRCDETFCLIDPPRWAWRAGPTARLNIGAVFFAMGQWISREAHGRVVRQRVIDDDDAVLADWGDLEQVRAELAEWHDD